MIRIVSLVWVLVAFSVTATAQKHHLVVEGVLKDADGKALSGIFDVTFSLYNAQDAESAQWTETVAKVNVTDGFFQGRLGQVKDLDKALFATNSSMWVGIALEGQPEFPRTPLETDPYAFRAVTSASADALECTGCVNETHLTEAWVESSKR